MTEAYRFRLSLKSRKSTPTVCQPFPRLAKPLIVYVKHVSETASSHVALIIQSKTEQNNFTIHKFNEMTSVCEFRFYQSHMAKFNMRDSTNTKYSSW